ncbi:hypothetical protein MCOR27_004686 [Pyricularia oryzae]|uniref:Protein BFR2 n=2 Tax=Pyricularia TaxID=48558 RepID=A0ABQ8NUH3_PYRGI|nr:hypothetical protein MCOR01_011058 [Pyricularia oryzae]KAI6302291.1 hypothetical protein MCOR33_002320 [Pyricularia grisea]KAH9437878.1 hypothetical protein MCOR02_001523 [Pyricularia oryzae]KAI6261956.1 hypothetical protein MCOR19_001771 [Pyricularia oryzae]KAI6267532.1 hypothetical protein MCOR26_009655 [Pyricularia oryzae]
MAPKKGRSQKFAELQEKAVKDYDPEADAPAGDSDEDSNSDGDSDGLAGTEHYVSVGKSKLRQADVDNLGPQYRGKRVSRSALDESDDDSAEESDEEDAESQGDDSSAEEFADPDTADLEADHIDADEEIDSDAALGASDEEKFAKFTFRGSSKPRVGSARRSKRPIAADFLSGSEEDEEDAGSAESDLGEGSEDSGDENDELESDEVSGPSDASEDDEDDEEEGDEDDSEGESDEESNAKNADLSAQLRKMMGQDGAQNGGTQSQAGLDKGRAVRQQRRSFDSLLNIRIRLQKALVAVNSMSTLSENESTEGQPYQAAEEAALKLWSTIDTFRRSLTPGLSATAAGQKRKRDIDMDTPLQDLWEDMGVVEARAASYRKKVLEKWSSKTKSTTAVTSKRQLGTTTVESLTSVLEDQLVNPDRLVKRTRVPRSCAPIQSSKKVQEDENIYDDADFYQLLLKELVDQRTLDGSGGGAGGSVPTVKWAAVKEARTRKVVDRRASKGRKLRFTVHEKLQNFMAPEDRRTWEQDAIDRFFGTLFGQKMELREDADGASEDEDMGGVDVDGPGLRLFG